MTRLEDLAPRARHLAEASMAVLDGWWDPAADLLSSPPGSFDEDPPRSLHLVPQSAWYAAGLLLRDAPGDLDRACQTLRAVVATQYDEPGAVWHGTFARFGGWPRPPLEGAVEWVDYDPNWREFAGTTFALVLHRLAGALPPEVTALLEASTDLAQRGEPEGRVPARYANIALMKAWLDADTGRRHHDADLVSAGEAFAGEVVELFRAHRAFEEYGSPTYYGVDLYALALWRELPPTPRFAEWAEEVEAALWRDIARWYHAGLGNLCGPYTRAYGMDLHRYAGMLGLWLWPVLGPGAPFPSIGGAFEHAHDLSMAPVAALLGPRVPADALAHLEAFRGERSVTTTITTTPRRVATGWLADDVMAGGEDAEEGWSAIGQYHPATVHWRLPQGGVGTIRVVHRGPLRATAGPGELRVRADEHRHKGPQPTVVEINAGTGPLDGIEPGRWVLPGLTVDVDGPTDGVEVGPGEVVWPPAPVELRLRLTPMG